MAAPVNEKCLLASFLARKEWTDRMTDRGRGPGLGIAFFDAAEFAANPLSVTLSGSGPKPHALSPFTSPDRWVSRVRLESHSADALKRRGRQTVLWDRVGLNSLQVM